MLKPCCAMGSLHTGKPTGRVAKVHGLDCYIADAAGSEPKGTIVIIPDAFGWTLPNTRILADKYAKHGFTVYLPEFMNGVVLPPDVLDSMNFVMNKTGISNQFAKIRHAAYLTWHFIPWMYRCRRSVCQPRVFDFVRAIKGPVGTAGFCWGGQHSVALAATDLTTCNFVAHPSFLTYPTDIEAVKAPLSVAAAEKDPQMSSVQANQTKEILAGKTAKGKPSVEHEFVMFPGVTHGFAVRADFDAKHEAEAGEGAADQAVKWFTRWMR